ncbi:transposase [Jiella pacifica]|uniref:Transposase n=1 Tax=Jiella pacifica TaxID=2696469 RepID=A0A6N9T9P4_9HYPH|nr:transposase [Jiella pacifica]NDW07981.1 hypothetical protein [Jiella pacifica]
MARALSIDLRHRVLRAMREGASTHAAAERFGIAIATAVRWRSQDWAGRSDPPPVGGDCRSGRIEAQAGFLFGLIEGEDDLTLAEMQRRLDEDRGVKVGIGTLWRFFDRHSLTWKKDRACERAGAPVSPKAAPKGSDLGYRNAPETCRCHLDAIPLTLSSQCEEKLWGALRRNCLI